MRRGNEDVEESQRERVDSDKRGKFVRLGTLVTRHSSTYRENAAVAAAAVRRESRYPLFRFAFIFIYTITHGVRPGLQPRYSCLWWFCFLIEIT